MNSYVKCKHCGADYGLHHYETNQCPAGGVEAPVGKGQVWSRSTFEESPAPKPARPTGPTLEYVRELEAELLATKAELVALALKADELVMELTGVDRPEDGPLVDSLPAAVSSVVYELMELAHSTLAAANEATP